MRPVVAEQPADVIRRGRVATQQPVLAEVPQVAGPCSRYGRQLRHRVRISLRLAPLRDRIRTLLCDPAFAYPDTETQNEEMREIVLGWTQLLADQGIGALAFPEYAGGKSDIEQFITAFETIAYHDLSLAIKFGVQFGLFGGSIRALGSEDQKRMYLADAGSLALPGCFAMTERGHGSIIKLEIVDGEFKVAGD